MLPYNDNDELDEESSGGSRSAIILWLIMASVGGFFVVLFLTSGSLTTENTTLQNDLGVMQQTLLVDPTANPTEEALIDELSDVRRQSRIIEPLHTNLVGNHADWSAVMVEIAAYDQTQMRLTSITQATNNRVILNGEAIDENSVIAYTTHLEDSELFSRVAVQSITRKAAPTAARLGNTTSTPEPSPFVVDYVIVLTMRVSTP